MSLLLDVNGRYDTTIWEAGEYEDVRSEDVLPPSWGKVEGGGSMLPKSSLSLQQEQPLIHLNDFFFRVWNFARFGHFAVPEDFESVWIGFELCFFQPF